ncbi:hypothetical protein STEG23_019439, partial [Scotinomys teguina]
MVGAGACGARRLRGGLSKRPEYETGVKMTSRFGKTYSRKGGNGSSKFDEVFSNKRTTLSTKWGETTFMAKLGQKRPNFKPDIQEIPKKPKVEEEDTGDPFGFDSDDESLPVSSKNLAPGKGSSYSESSEAAQPEEVTSVLEANSTLSHVVGEDSLTSDRCLLMEETLIGKEKSTNRISEDNANKSSCAKLITS